MFYPRSIDNLNESAILKHYFPNFKGTGKYISNLRCDDKNESMHITVRGGRIIISDFGRTDCIGLTVLNYVKKLTGIEDYGDLVCKIAYDMKDNLNVPTSTFKLKLEEKQPPLIRYKSREYFSWKKDEEFWQPLLKSVERDDLIAAFKFFNIKFADYYWINSLGLKAQEENPTYVYVIKKYCKLYSPFSTDFKWVSNVPKNEIFGYQQLPKRGKLLIIDKSLKDVLVNYFIGIPSISLPSESVFIPIEILKELLTRFEQIVIHTDNDRSGTLAAEQFSKEYNLDYYLFNEEDTKDNFEFIRKYDLQTLKEYLNERI